MTPRTAFRSTPFQLLVFAGMALVFAVVSNAFASPSRRLTWWGLPPAAPPVQVSSTASPNASSSSASEATRIQIVPLQKADSLRKESTPTQSSKSTPASKPVPPTEAFPADAAHPIREIESEEAWRAYQSKIPFLDARRSSDFLDGHVPGAWNLCVWESDLEVRMTVFEATAHPSTKSPMVLYCTGGDCEDSHLLASKFMALGYRNLLIYRDGYPDWIKQGHPMEKGARP